MKQEIKFQETRVLANTLIITAQPDRTDADKALTASWTEYRYAMFPYQREQMQSQDQAALDYLRKEVARGPVTVRPMAPLTSAQGMRSKRRRARHNEG
jgi:hypothetical protein